MPHSPALMLHNQKHKQYTRAYGRNREEVYGDDLAEVIPQEGLPGLGGGRFTVRRMRETVRFDTSMPSLCSSP